jgi:hypothetical protein
MRVKNINGASDRNCRLGSWLLHWAYFSQRPLPPCCSARNCISRPAAGALVQLDVDGDETWYVVPLCSWHNAHCDGTMDLADRAVLVRADAALRNARGMPVPAPARG